MAKIFDAYVAGDARAFFGGQHYKEREDRVRAVQRAVRPLPPGLAAAIAAQNARLAPSRAREQNLDALRRGAAAVVTGQQVGLFLGPLYTIYKAATAVRLARLLAEESGAPVVPVFWIQSEDHDLPEIAVCHVPTPRGEPLALRLPAYAEDRISLAHRTLPSEVEDRLAELRAEIGNLPHAEEHIARLARHYRPGARWVEAFTDVIGALFAEEGLVLVDPRDPRDAKSAIAEAAAGVHRRAIERAAPMAEALLARIRELEAAGFSAEVHVRGGAPLSFFHPDGAGGPRYRLEPVAGGFKEVGGHPERVHTPAEIFQAIDADPLVVSSSALLRPIVQDTLLPTAAYVGGPSETAYFAQLPPLYAAFDLPMPLVVPRARFSIVEDKTQRILTRLGLTSADARRPEDELLAAARDKKGAHPEGAAIARALLEPFESVLHELSPRIEAAGAGLDKAIEKTRGTVETAVKKLADKIDHARLHEDQALVEDVRRLKALLYPGGVPGERVYGLPYFAARYGERAFLERVLAAIAPLDTRPQDLCP